MHAVIRLPRPISTNSLFANVKGRGRVCTKAYNQWKWQAKAKLSDQKPLPKFAEPVQIALLVGEKGVGRMDADNAVKAYLDALVAANVIPDDNRNVIRRIVVEWVAGVEGCTAHIRNADAPEAVSIPILGEVS